MNKAHAVVMIVNSETGEILNAQIASIQSDASIAEMNNDFELNLCPNPVSDLLTVSFNLFTKSRATVRNVLETKPLIDVFIQFRGQYTTINTSELSNGVYFLSVESGAPSRQKDLLSRINEV